MTSYLHFCLEYCVSVFPWSDISAIYCRCFDGEMTDRECKVFCEIGCGMTLPGTDKNRTLQLCHFVKISCWQKNKHQCNICHCYACLLTDTLQFKKLKNLQAWILKHEIYMNMLIV